MELPRLVDAGHVAEALSTTREVIYNPIWRRRVGLRAVRIGRALRFLASDVEALIGRGLEGADRDAAELKASHE